MQTKSVFLWKMSFYLKLQSGSHEMRSIVVNILTFYIFNGNFIWKINIKYLLYQVAFWLMHKNIFKIQWEVMSARLQPTFFRNGQTQLFIKGKYLFYVKNKEKTPPFSSFTSRL